VEKHLSKLDNQKKTDIKSRRGSRRRAFISYNIFTSVILLKIGQNQHFRLNSSPRTYFYDGFDDDT